MNADDLIALNEEIAGMARAGLPLDKGLARRARDGPGKIAARDDGPGRRPPFRPNPAGRPRTPQGRAAAVLREPGGRRRSHRPHRRCPRLAHPLCPQRRRRPHHHPRRVLLSAHDRRFLPGHLRLHGLFRLAAVRRHIQGFRSVAALDHLGDADRDRAAVAVRDRAAAAVLDRRAAGTLVLNQSEEGRCFWLIAFIRCPSWVRWCSPPACCFHRAAGDPVEHAVPLPEAIRLAGASSSDPLMARTVQKIEGS